MHRNNTAIAAPPAGQATPRAEIGPIVMRDWIDADIDAYAELVGDPLVMRYISDGGTRGRRRAESEIERFSREIAMRGWSRFVIALAEDDSFAGYMGFAEVDGEIDFGGRLRRDLWRSRIGPLGFCLALEYGFDILGFESLFATVHPDNANALALMEAFFGPCETRLIESLHGPVKRFDLSRERFEGDGIREKNRAFMARAARVKGDR